jgi:hypothetical protein
LFDRSQWGQLKLARLVMAAVARNGTWL